MRRFGRALFVLLAVALAASHANAADRLALLIGNQSYNAKVGPLQNPHNDIALIGAALRSLKFAVTEIKDADYRLLDTAIKRHAQTVRREGQGAISFVYYSGHGAADPDTKTNYLIPVDVANANDDDLWVNSLNLNAVIEGLRAQAPQATHYVVFDACRNELNLTVKGKRVLADRGFVPVNYTPGVMIAYATAPGKTATDIGPRGAPYAKALAEEITKPGIEAVTMFRRVALRVNREIGQDPWISASTLPEIYLGGEAVPADTEITLLKQQLAKLESELKQQQQQQTSASSDKEVKALKDELAKSQAELKKREEEQKRQQVAAIPPPAAKPATAPLAKPATHAVPAPSLVTPGSVFRDCADCPEMVVVPAGSFMMGSPTSEEGRTSWEGPQRKVTIGRRFAVGKYEVSFAEWDACEDAGGCKHRPSDQGWGRGKRPAIDVSFDDVAKEYLPWLSRKTGKTYRLLTEAEWEYAARAGTTTPYAFGNTVSKNQAQYSAGALGSAAKTVEVGSFRPNAFGLYDMQGNVAEWVEDCWHNNYAGAPANGSAWTASCSESSRVRRGGSWYEAPLYLRSAMRNMHRPDDRDNSIGFRLARNVD